MRLCIFSCRICCPTSDRSPSRNDLHTDRRLAFASSCTRTTVQGDVVQVAASRAEEGDGASRSDRRLDGKSIHQPERVLTLSAAQPTTRDVSRPICGKYFEAAVVAMPRSCDFPALEAPP